jgi:hypothetical protein
MILTPTSRPRVGLTAGLVRWRMRFRDASGRRDQAGQDLADGLRVVVQVGMRPTVEDDEFLLRGSSTPNQIVSVTVCAESARSAADTTHNGCVRRVSTTAKAFHPTAVLRRDTSASFEPLGCGSRRV